MIETLPAPARKLIAVALLALAGALIWAVVAPLLAHHRELAAEIETERRLRGRYAVIAAEPVPPESTAPPSTGFIEAASEPIALASLQARLGAIVQRSGVLPRSVAPLAARDRGPLRMIGLRIQAGVTPDRLQRLLHALASTEPVLLVEALQISARATGAAAGREGEQLEARLDVWAAVRRPEAP